MSDGDYRHAEWLQQFMAHGTVLLDAQARPLAETVGWARHHARPVILTGGQSTADVVARALIESGVADCPVLLVDRASGAAYETSLRAVASGEMNRGKAAADPALALLRPPDWTPPPLLRCRPDDAYIAPPDLVMERHLRLLCLGKLQISETDTVWDIGAGSGAVSIEMAELAWRGEVYAIENEPEHLDCIRQNIARYATPNVQVVQGAAPSVLADLAAPSAVFLGGTGGAVEAILAAIAQRAQPGCRLVASFILLENVTRALAVAEERGWPFEMIQAQISLGEAHGTETRLAPHSEAFILSATLGGAETLVKQDA